MIDDPPGSHYHHQSVNHPRFGKRRNITTKYNKFFKKYTDLIFLLGGTAAIIYLLLRF